MATVADIREKTAKKLYILSTGQTLQSEITEDLEAAYDEVYYMLDAQGLTTWDVADDIPEEMVWPVVALMAFQRANEYSIPNDHYQRITTDAAMAVPKIREMLASDAYDTPQADYF
jgi:hypothetical protein